MNMEKEIALYREKVKRYYDNEDRLIQYPTKRPLRILAQRRSRAGNSGGARGSGDPIGQPRKMREAVGEDLDRGKVVGWWIFGSGAIPRKRVAAADWAGGGFDGWDGI